MAHELPVSEVIEDLRVADEMLRRFERLYWLSSEQLYELYDQGLLDEGEHLLDFSQTGGFCKLRQRRLEASNRLSRERVTHLRINGEPIHLKRRESILEPAQVTR